MEWLRRIAGRGTEPEVEEREPPPEPMERSSPGTAALFRGVNEDRSHAVLDLGAAADSSLQVYSRFARWVRFADLLPAATRQDGWRQALETIPAHPERPYDLVFAWNILDWVAPEDRPRLITRLAELTAADARLLVVLQTAEGTVRQPLRFSLLNVDRMRYEPAGAPQPAWPPLLPAEVERLLQPFGVERAFTSQVGLREYMAVRT